MSNYKATDAYTPLNKKETKKIWTYKYTLKQNTEKDSENPTKKKYIYRTDNKHTRTHTHRYIYTTTNTNIYIFKHVEWNSILRKVHFWQNLLLLSSIFVILFLKQK